MLRIGVAASKMSKGGSLLSYNLYVVGISCLFALFAFLICGFGILLLLFLISLIAHTNAVHTSKISLSVLGVAVMALNIIAIAKNIQLPKKKI